MSVMNMRTLFAEVLLAGPINLKATLECGQAFRWRRAQFPGRPDIPIAYSGVIGATAMIVGQVRPVTRSLFLSWEVPSDSPSPAPSDAIDAVKHYFSEGDDIERIESELAAKDEVMAEAVRYGSGLRILRQDSWECLASYSLSQNNSIPNISAIIERLSACYGEIAGMGRHSFPRPGAIACRQLTDLRQTKCGFRDRYLHDAAVRVLDGRIDLKAMESMPNQEARRELMSIKGVGPKVADCVLLFGFHRLGVFPVDVWIARAMSRYYLGGRIVKPLVARQEGEKRFGSLAGYAQEYLFNWIRNCG